MSQEPGAIVVMPDELQPLYIAISLRLAHLSADEAFQGLKGTLKEDVKESNRALRRTFLRIIERLDYVQTMEPSQWLTYGYWDKNSKEFVDHYADPEWPKSDNDMNPHRLARWAQQQRNE